MVIFWCLTWWQMASNSVTFSYLCTDLPSSGNDSNLFLEHIGEQHEWYNCQINLIWCDQNLTFFQCEDESKKSKINLGKEAPFLCPDTVIENCVMCAGQFNMLRRPKHHCHACGIVSTQLFYYLDFNDYFMFYIAYVIWTVELDLIFVFTRVIDI